MSAVDLVEWVQSLLGHGLPERSITGCSVSLAAKSMDALNLMEHRLDEEGLTVSLVGCLASALPLSFLAFGGQHPDDGSEFGWAQYSKHGRDAISESMRGADFAIVIRRPDDRIRLAVFQAKSDWSKSARDGYINLRQARDTEEGVKFYQLNKLHETGCDLAARAGVLHPGTADLHWVHYLCQMRGALSCLALTQIEDRVADELLLQGDPKVEVDQYGTVPFSHVLRSAFSSDQDGWLELNLRDLDGKVPQCVELTKLARLMNLLVSEDGTRGLDNVFSSFTNTPLVHVSGTVGDFNVEYKPPYSPPRPRT